jgi:hypothetical protein
VISVVYVCTFMSYEIVLVVYSAGDLIIHTYIPSICPPDLQHFQPYVRTCIRTYQIMYTISHTKTQVWTSRPTIRPCMHTYIPDHVYNTHTKTQVWKYLGIQEHNILIYTHTNNSPWWGTWPQTTHHGGGHGHSGGLTREDIHAY